MRCIPLVLGSGLFVCWAAAAGGPDRQVHRAGLVRRAPALRPSSLRALQAPRFKMPAALKGGFESCDTPLPESARRWEDSKGALRAKLRSALGDWPPLFTPKPTVKHREDRDGYVLEKFEFDNGVGDTVYGYVLIPTAYKHRRPAVFSQHGHGAKFDRGKEELLLKGAFKHLDFAVGENLVRCGYVVMAIDAYSFGKRRWQGPAGKAEEGRATESSLFKAFLWTGRSLWGMIVRDDILALNYLLSRPDVDPQRVAIQARINKGTWGISKKAASRGE